LRSPLPLTALPLATFRFFDQTLFVLPRDYLNHCDPQFHYRRPCVASPLASTLANQQRAEMRWFNPWSSFLEVKDAGNLSPPDALLYLKLPPHGHLHFLLLLSPAPIALPRNFRGPLEMRKLRSGSEAIRRQGVLIENVIFLFPPPPPPLLFFFC